MEQNNTHDMRYLKLLARDYPNAEAAAAEIINLSAERSLPKGTEYFFSDLHGEYQSFLRLLRSASGMIRTKIDLIFDKSLSSDDREELASLIYYPEEELKSLRQKGKLTDEWLRISIYRLILVSETVSAKYTRAGVRAKMPKDFGFILDELLNVTSDINKDFYYDTIIDAIIGTGAACDFIISVCELIRGLTMDQLHIIGDIFDRGPRADKIMEELIRFDRVDIQWGNHDISWMGAASGNMALVANVIRIALGYNSFDVLEDGYGLNLRPLSVFADQVYRDDPCTHFYPRTLDEVVYDSIDADLTAKMHKAISVIQFKLEGQLMKKHPEYHMDSRRLFEKTDFRKGTVEIDGETFLLRDTYFPTVDPDDPLRLTEEEQELIRILQMSFHHSTVLNSHIRFLYAKGAMYKTCNGNLLYHGSIPMTEEGEFKEIALPFAGEEGKLYHGKALLDRIGTAVNRAYFAPFGTPEQEEACDYMWYLWCGEDSPLYGKDKMAFFERTLLCDKDRFKENYAPYYRVNNREDVCVKILREFGLDGSKGHIINGHVPVLIKEGQSPVKGNGKLFIIDGGISKAYQSKTGIAGYTLIYNSHSILLAEHKPYDGNRITPNVSVAVNMDRRVNIADVDFGEELLIRIEELKGLLEAYRNGDILERSI